MGYSFYRRLTHASLADLELMGKVLDLGGSHRSAYTEVFKGDHDLSVLNIDPAADPDITWDLEEIPYPVEDRSFDAVLAINVLEHLWNWRGLLTEANRILKPGGQLIIAVPFLYYEHPSPHDFFRYTGESCRRMLEEAGFTAVTVVPIAAGVFNARHSLLGRFLPGWLEVPCGYLAQGMDALLIGLSRLMGRQYTGAEYPLGYLVRGTRPDT